MDQVNKDRIEQSSPFSVHRQRRVDHPGSGVIYRNGYWYHDGCGVAIVAAVNSGHDWAAYVGHGSAPDEHEDETLVYVAEHGVKLDEATARFLFPGLQERWRR